MRFDVTTDASPGQVLQALTDFTERCPRIWHRTLDPKTYELRELGDTWAVGRSSGEHRRLAVLGRRALRLVRSVGGALGRRRDQLGRPRLR